MWHECAFSEVRWGCDSHEEKKRAITKWRHLLRELFPAPQRGHDWVKERRSQQQPESYLAWHGWGPRTGQRIWVWGSACWRPERLAQWDGPPGPTHPRCCHSPQWTRPSSVRTAGPYPGWSRTGLSIPSPFLKNKNKIKGKRKKKKRRKKYYKICQGKDPGYRVSGYSIFLKLSRSFY